MTATNSSAPCCARRCARRLGGAHLNENAAANRIWIIVRAERANLICADRLARTGGGGGGANGCGAVPAQPPAEDKFSAAAAAACLRSAVRGGLVLFAANEARRGMQTGQRRIVAVAVAEDRSEAFGSAQAARQTNHCHCHCEGARG